MTKSPAYTALSHALYSSSLRALALRTGIGKNRLQTLRNFPGSTTLGELMKLHTKNLLVLNITKI